MTSFRARIDQWRWALYWRRYRATREHAADLGLTPKPPDEFNRRGERAPELLNRVALIHLDLAARADRISADIFDAFAKRAGYADVEDFVARAPRA